MPDPIYKTKDGQQVTKQQLLGSGYSEERISNGVSNGILLEIGDTNISGQIFKTRDGQQVTYDDLIYSGYSEERINKGVQNGVLSAIEKKKTGNNTSKNLPISSEVGISPFVPQSPLVERGNEFSTPFYGHDTPKVIAPNGYEIPISRRTIPATPYNDDNYYISGLQERINKGTTTEQDNKVLSKNQSGSKFNENDDFNLSQISKEIDPSNELLFSQLYQTNDEKVSAINKIKDVIKNKFTAKVAAEGNPYYISPDYDDETKSKLDELDDIKEKISKDRVKEGTYPIYITSTESTDESGSIWNKYKAGVIGVVGMILGKSDNVSEKVKSLPPEFSMGVDYLKGVEPVEAERITKALVNGKPISESQVAQLTNIGLDIREEMAKDLYADGTYTKEQYIDESSKIINTRVKTLLDNKETLRAVLSSGIANTLGEIRFSRQASNPMIGIVGNSWNYSDAEIDAWGKTYAKTLGLDPNDARVKDAIKYLQDNESAMFLDNSIAKDGLVRYFTKGVVGVGEGLVKGIKDIPKSKSDIYTESKSQMISDISQDRLDYVKKDPVLNTMASVTEGAGQFAAQAALAAATSGAIGGAGRLILGRTGQVALAGDIAIADMGASGIAGKILINSKDALATYITSYAQVYDSNLKQAMSYTADDNTATKVAMGMSFLEGATEQFLSPLEIARGIGKSLFNKKEALSGLVSIMNDAAIVNKKLAVAKLIKGTLTETGRVALAEIGEEEVTQLADIAVNGYLNPNSKSYKDRDLMKEVWNTAKETGLSMAVPALMSGAGAYKANNFTKGSLMEAAQSRQQTIDILQKAHSEGRITDDELNQKISIVNTAARANAAIPIKENGVALSPKEKADYIFSQTAEAVLNRQIEDRKKPTSEGGLLPDAAKDKQAEKKIKQQQEFRENMLSLKPMYHVNGEMVDKKEFDKVLKIPNVNEYDLSVENDNETQEKLRKIGGKDVDVKDATEILKETKQDIDEGLHPLADIKEEYEIDGNVIVKDEIESQALPKDANSLLKEARDKGSLGVFKTMPDEDALQMISQQAQNLDGKGNSNNDGREKMAMNSTINQFGKELVNAAILKYPKRSGIIVSQVVDGIGTHNDKSGYFEQEGQTLVFHDDDGKRMVEIGNINEIQSKPIEEFGISYEQSEVSVNDTGDFIINGKSYKAKHEDNNLLSINRDNKGGIVSVQMREKKNGQKKTFKGQVAEDIAYQIHLKEINKNDETRTRFENFINEDAEIRDEIENGGLQETSTKDATENNGEVQSEKIEPSISPKQEPSTESKKEVVYPSKSEEVKVVEDKIKKDGVESVSTKDIAGLKGEERDDKVRFTDEETKVISDHYKDVSELKRLQDEAVKMIMDDGQIDSKIGDKITEISDKIKSQEKDLPKGTVKGKINDGIPSFSDLVAFEYTEDINDWKGRVADIGGTVYAIGMDGKMKPIPFVEWDAKTGTYKEIKKPDRAERYGNTVPKSGEFVVSHGSPNGRIEKFDENQLGKGFQREEFDHERFEGVYASDNTESNAVLGRGYGQVHEYNLKFDNSISERNAEKLLEAHEKEIGNRLSRKAASKYIKSLGYDMIYRSEGDGTYTFVGLDVNKITPKILKNDTETTSSTGKMDDANKRTENSNAEKTSKEIVSKAVKSENKPIQSEKTKAAATTSVLNKPIEDVSIEDIMAEIENLKSGKIGEADMSNSVLKSGDKDKIQEYISKAKSVLNGLYPKAKLEVYNSENEYEDAGGTSGSRGFAIMAKNGEHRILLNLAQISEDNSGKTAFHEVIHPIVYDAFSINQNKLVPIWNDIAITMKDVSGMEEVFNHIQWYGQDKIAAEGITETLTQIAAGNIDLKDVPQSTKNKIIDLINRLLDSLGISLKLNSINDFAEIAKKIKDSFDNSNADNLKSVIKGQNIDKFISDQEKISDSDAGSDKLKKLQDLLKSKVESEVNTGKLTQAQADKLVPILSVSEANIKMADKVVENIAANKTTLAKALEYIYQQKLSEATKNKVSNYIKDKLSDLKKGTKKGLEPDERGLFDNLDNDFLNGIISYEEAMYQLGSVIDSEQDLVAKEKYENIRNAFYKENHKRAVRIEKETKEKEFKNFNEEINDTKFGFSEDELTTLESDARVLRSGTQQFMDKNSFVNNSDQVRAMFQFSQYANDLNTLIDKFRQHFGVGYMHDMINFIKNKNNQLDARITTSVAFNNHLENILETEQNLEKRIKYYALLKENARESQDLGTRVGLALNTLRAWNNDRLSDMAWVGLVKPDLTTRAQAIEEALGSDISEEDLFNDEQGVIENEDEKSDNIDIDSTGKTAGYFKKKKIKLESKNINLPDSQKTKNNIQEQKKNCK